MGSDTPCPQGSTWKPTFLRIQHGLKDDHPAEGQAVDLVAVTTRSAEPRLRGLRSPARTRVPSPNADPLLDRRHLTVVESEPVRAVELAAADERRAVVARRADPHHLLAAPRAVGPGRGRGRRVLAGDKRPGGAGRD